MPAFLKNSKSLFALRSNNRNKTYEDNLCFFRNVICSRELAKLPKKIRPQKIKAADVKTLHSELRSRMPELSINSKDFRGFNLTQLNIACQRLKVNGYIFDCDLTADGVEGRVIEYF